MSGSKETTQNKGEHYSNSTMIWYNVWGVFNGYWSLITWWFIELFMFWVHDFHVNDRNQVRYLSVMSGSKGTTQNKVEKFSTMIWYNIWCVLNGYWSCSIWLFIKLFMFWVHDFHVNDENQVRYLSVVSVSRGTMNHTKIVPPWSNTIFGVF